MQDFTSVSDGPADGNAVWIPAKKKDCFGQVGAAKSPAFSPPQGPRYS